ncbi:MAG: ABC transporter permease [Gammaproteobacteria bacterium]|nr:ABC transporter permease [Gammaproteobacteria bacterium]
MITFDTTGAKYRRVSLVIGCIAVVALLIADLEISNNDPASELWRLLHGLMVPSLELNLTLVEAVFNTIAFALVGLAIGASIGLLLAPYHHVAVIRHVCAFVRAIHEIFWALIFLQMFGLSALTGVLAIAVPYAGIFAKVYDDLLAQTTIDRTLVFDPNCSRLSSWLYGPLAQCWPALARYTRYRFECALRSATVLGFIGLPTLGYYLETAFNQGLYHQAGALLLIMFALVATIKWWLHRAFIPVYLIAALWYLPWQSALEWQYLVRFVTEDIIPAPLKTDNWLFSDLLQWLNQLWLHQILPGGWATLVLSVAALLVTALVSLTLWPFASRMLVGRGQVVGHGLLIVLRSTPELIFTFVITLVIGPSMLPAIIALALHNGGIIAYLLARSADRLELRDDHASGVNLWAYELQPALYPSFLTFLFYRFEVILRESAILGMLGITTLGFYIDSAFEALFFDVACILILVTALLNMLVNQLSIKLRRYFDLDKLVLV